MAAPRASARIICTENPRPKRNEKMVMNLPLTRIPMEYMRVWSTHVAEAMAASICGRVM